MNTVRKTVGLTVGKEREESMGKGPDEEQEHGIFGGLKNGLCSCSRGAHSFW